MADVEKLKSDIEVIPFGDLEFARGYGQRGVSATFENLSGNFFIKQFPQEVPVYQLQTFLEILSEGRTKDVVRKRYGFIGEQITRKVPNPYEINDLIGGTFKFNLEQLRKWHKAESSEAYDRVYYGSELPQIDRFIAEAFLYTYFEIEDYLNEKDKSKLPRFYGINFEKGQNGYFKMHLVFEYLDGISLDKIEFDQSVQSLSAHCSNFLDLCRTLEVFHPNFLYRDFKPQNLMLVGDQIRLVDLEFMRALSELHTSRLSLGTPYYIPAEILYFNKEGQTRVTSRRMSSEAFNPSTELYGIYLTFWVSFFHVEDQIYDPGQVEKIPDILSKVIIDHHTGEYNYQLNTQYLVERLRYMGVNESVIDAIVTINNISLIEMPELLGEERFNYISTPFRLLSLLLKNQDDSELASHVKTIISSKVELKTEIDPRVYLALDIENGNIEELREKLKRYSPDDLEF